MYGVFLHRLTALADVDSMISALNKISGRTPQTAAAARLSPLPEEAVAIASPYAHLFLNNPPAVYSWLSTHPSLEERVTHLQKVRQRLLELEQRSG